MCGIIGYIGNQPAVPILLEGLRRLEYRGYDSAGVATLAGGRIELRKRIGRIANLASLIKEAPPEGNIGISHTRWATHGGVTDDNAHPHTDQSGKLVICHNGVIENYSTLREQLTREGHVFKSQTDTGGIGASHRQGLLTNWAASRTKRAWSRPFASPSSKSSARTESSSCTAMCRIASWEPAAGVPWSSASEMEKISSPAM
jgi:glutamine phosphoribosylpyrophosphate amidotransferase